MSSTVIRDFLVALTFKTDDTGAKKSKDALDSNEKSAKILSQTLISLASIAVIAVAKTANELEKLFYSSQRIGASANNIRAYGDAISQMGGSAEGAISSLESVARKLRESPGYEGMLKGLGVTTRDQNGQMRDRVEVMKDLSKTLQGMEYYKANNYANALGIDESTLMAMRDGKFTSEMEKYQKLRKDMGLNDELAKSGQEFAYQWRDMTMQLKALMEVIVMTAGKALIPVLKLLNQLIQFAIHWFGQLNPHIKTFLASGLKIAMLTVVFGGLFSAIGKFAKLLPMLTGLLNIFKALRLVFLASPIGIVLALAAAIALLWDDYQTWKRGGESLIDWEKWSNGIDMAISKIRELGGWLKDLTKQGMDLMFGEGSYDGTVDWTSRNIVEPIMNGTALSAISNALAPSAHAETTGVKEKISQATIAGANMVLDAVNAVKGDVDAKTSANQSLNQNINTKNFTPEKAKAIADVAKRIGVDPNDLAAVISFETSGTFSPSIKNNGSSATGLIQFMGKGATKRGNYNNGTYFGMSRSEFSSLSFTEQMKYVEHYFKERGFNGKKMRDVADTYTAVTGYGYKKGSEAYDKNKVWDSNKNGVVEKGEMVLNPSFRAHQKKYFTKSDEVAPNIMKEKLAKIAQNAEVPNNINPVVPNLSNTQSSNRNVNINQKTDIHVTGGDAMVTAKAVRKEQDAVNLQMTRNSVGIFT